MAARRIRLEVEGVQATAELYETLSPKSAEAFWQSLPIETALIPAKWSGQACYFEVTGKPLAELPETPELGVTSIYQGYMVVFPSPARGRAELLISYGLAEYRWPTGRRYVTPLAELDGDGSALFDALRRTQSEGQTTVSVRRAEG